MTVDVDVDRFIGNAGAFTLDRIPSQRGNTFRSNLGGEQYKPFPQTRRVVPAVNNLEEHPL